MDPLDGLPLDVLLALQEAVADPSDQGRARAAKRAENAGFHIRLLPGSPMPPAAAYPPRFDPEPIPMEEAEEGVESLWLRFDR
jgi:hypothetical protein